MPVKLKQASDGSVSIKISSDNSGRSLKPLSPEQYAELEQAVLTFKDEREKGCDGVEINSDEIGVTYLKKP